MTTTSDLTASERTVSRWAVLLGATAAAVSVAATWSGSTSARLLVAVVLPMAVVAWITASGATARRGRWLVLPVLCGLLGSAHVVLSSPAAAWVVDSHMAPRLAALMPGGGARLALAWSVPVVWALLLLSMAVAAYRRRSMPGLGVLLATAGFAPMMFADSFPTNAYLLLWNTTVFTHPTYTVGAFAVLFVAVTTTHQTRSPRVTAEA